MTLPDLHPDELLAREASSALTPREWADLSAHLERCPACALERAARREAARVRVPSDLDHAIAARVVGRLLDETRTAQREPAPVKRGGGRRLVYAALVLVLVSGTAMAGVALVAQIRQRNARLEPESRRAPTARVAPKRHRAIASAGRAEEEQAQEQEQPPALAPSEVAPTMVEPAAPAPEMAPAGPALVARPELEGSRPAAIGRRRSSPEHTPLDRPAADAAAVLSQAQAAESAGRLAGASQLYGELGRRFPGTSAEIVSRALHGQLLLERLRSPTRALALFDAYLDAAPSGTLAEEARLGRARALEQLGRPDEERSAWLELLRAHPRSVHAAAARARLEALDRP